MSAFNKFNSFVADIAHGIHTLNSDTLAVFLSNTLPAATDTVYDGTAGLTGPAEISGGNGYVTGGLDVTTTSSSQTAGIYSLILADPPLITATGGQIEVFRYVILYNKTAGNRLIGWWDYGTSVTLAASESFQIDFDQTNGVLTLS